MSGPWHRKSPGCPRLAPSSLASDKSGMESVQRIVLAAPRSVSIREAEKIFLVDGFQIVHDCLLDDLVLQTQNAEGPLGAVRLRDVRPSGRSGPVAAPMHSLVQVGQLHLYLDDIFPRSYGQPLIGGTSSAPR